MQILLLFFYILSTTTVVMGNERETDDYYADKEFKRFNCQGKTAAAVYNALSTNKVARIGHGFHKGNPHRWVEVFNPTTDIWEMRDKAIKSVGNSSYPLEAFKTGDKPDYTVRYYEQPF